MSVATAIGQISERVGELGVLVPDHDPVKKLDYHDTVGEFDAHKSAINSPNGVHNHNVKCR